jgi:hypothetical protein
MRLWAAAALLLLSCEPIADLQQPEFRVTRETTTGELAPSEGGTLDFGPVSRSCWTDEWIRITNVGLRRARFTLSAPSELFVYEQGPFELGPGEKRLVAIRLVALADGTQNSARHDLRIVPDDAPTSTHPLTFSIASLDTEVARLDFGAVLLGQQSSLVAPDVSNVSGDYRKSGSELIFTPTSIGPRAITADFTLSPHCAPARVRVEGDGIQAILVDVTPATVGFAPTPLGMTAEATVAINLFSNDELTLSVRQTASHTSSEMSPFTVEPIPSATTLMFRGGDRALVPAHREYRVRFTPTSGGPIQHYLHGWAGGQTFTVALRGSGT